MPAEDTLTIDAEQYRAALSEAYQVAIADLADRAARYAAFARQTAADLAAERTTSQQLREENAALRTQLDQALAAGELREQLLTEQRRALTELRPVRDTPAATDGEKFWELSTGEGPGEEGKTA